MKLVVVTATTDAKRAEACLNSWEDTAKDSYTLVVVRNNDREAAVVTDADIVARWVVSKNYLGTVPAFNLGVKKALELGADIIAAFHDDLEITEDGWDDKVLEHFRRHPRCGLAGFGGAIALGAADMYQKPYDPMSLARQGFRSNMREAEAHGIRSTLAERVACLDGFCQIGRREFWEGQDRTGGWTIPDGGSCLSVLQEIEDHGIVHHFYDGVLGALAAKHGWETWYLPVACHHYGGRTAVGDSGYQAWAKSKIPGGDQGFWEQSHRHAYDWLTDCLPVRV